MDFVATARRARAAALALCVVVVPALAADGASAAKRKPDLVVRSVQGAPSTLRTGATFAATAAVANAGKARAGRSVVRFSLVPVTSGARAAVGTRAAPGLARRRSSRAKATLRVPATLAAGGYRIVACADATRRVRESNERNNCRTSPTRIAVAAPAAPAPIGGPLPEPGTTLPPDAGLPPDTTPPAAPTIDAHPAAGSRTRSAEFRFAGVEPGLTFRCTLDGGPAQACSSPLSVAGLTDGQHTFAVIARDGAGLDSPPASFTWLVDATVPHAPSIAGRPAQPTRSQTATLTFAGDADATFECRLDAADFATCTSPKVYSGLPEGAHAFAVRARDAVGNESPHATADWTIDRTAPAAPTIASRPADPLYGESATFTFTSAESGVEFRCRVDAQPAAPCSSPATYGSLHDGAHAFGVSSVDAAGNESDEAGDGWIVNVLPPDPEDVAPQVSRAVGSSLGETAAFLYTGDDPVQLGVAPGAIAPRRVSVIRGRAVSRAGDPLPGVTISAPGHPELGHTKTREDGGFDFAVNGGGSVTIEYARDGLLPAQRTLQTVWEDYTVVDDVALVALDGAVTAVRTGADAPPQVARAGAVSDGDGSRRATLVFAAQTVASMTLADGSTRLLDDLHVRATEYTVGERGPNAMPGTLPPTTDYTYAVELSVDEALAAGAESVQFDKPVAFYLENFLGFQVGGAVPVGYYDRGRGEWIASKNGRVVKIVSESGGRADVDTDGDGSADNEGIDVAERERLADLYAAGQELWRAALTHFTPYDLNWRMVPVRTATPPKAPPPRKPKKPPNFYRPECTSRGSAIGCQTSSLGESVEIAGTPYRLHYTSARSPERAASRTIEIPITGPSVPDGLRGIRLEISVAGRRLVQRVPVEPDRTFTFTWDGRDAYGRALQGEQRVFVRLGFEYQTVYIPANPGFDSFALMLWDDEFAGAGIFGRRDTVVWRDWQATVGGWTSSTSGIGGWTLSAHHDYAPATQTLYRGDGVTREASDFARVVSSVAGARHDGGSGGDNGEASLTPLTSPAAVDMGPDGSLYIAEGDRIRKVTEGGAISTFAGSARPCSDSGDCLLGDGGPAGEARLSDPRDVAAGADGAIYIADTHNDAVRRVAGDGTIATIAGTGSACAQSCGNRGDFGPATAAIVEAPIAVASAPDGSVYVLEQRGAVRRVGSDGQITTLAGLGQLNDPADGARAVSASLQGASDMALGLDGSIFVSQRSANAVRRIGSDGLIYTAAGTGASGYSGDGAAASLARLHEPAGVTVDGDGTLYIADGSQRIRRVAPDGIITTFAGSFRACTESTAYVQCNDGIAHRSTFGAVSHLAVGPDREVYVADAVDGRIRKIAIAYPKRSDHEMVVAAQDGNEVYIFSAAGRHLRTLDPLTNVALARFGYDAGGRLVTVTDRDDRTTTIERDDAGRPVAVVAPAGQRTELQLDANGYLARVENPTGDVVRLATTAGGLLSELEDAVGGLHRFEYDAMGHLTRDTGPGGVQDVTATQLPEGVSVSIAGPAGTRTFSSLRRPTGEIVETVVEPGVGTTTTVHELDGATTTTRPGGESEKTYAAPDPRFGMQSPIIVEAQLRAPSGKTTTFTGGRTVSLRDPADPLSLNWLEDHLGSTDGISRMNYDADSRTFTRRSVSGRKTVEKLNERGRLAELHPSSGPKPRSGRDGKIIVDPGGAAGTPVHLTYNADGSLAQVAQGTREVTYAYDARGRVTERHNAAGTTRYGYDAADRLVMVEQPGGRRYRFGSDASGRRTSLTLPSGAAHRFDYTAAGGLAGITPATGGGSYGRAFAADGGLASITLPSGRSETLSRDGDGALSAIATAETTAAFTRDEAGNVVGFDWTRAGGATQSTAITRDGDLITAVASTGAAPGSYDYEYDDERRLSAMTLDAGAPTLLGYDVDGLLTTLGPYELTRNGAGRVSRISTGEQREEVTYDAVKRIASRTYHAGGAELYAIAFSYGDTDLVTQRRERRGDGAVVTSDYEYDEAGRLASVRVDGELTESYAYDVDGNRISRRLADGSSEDVAYDANRQLARRGTEQYAFDADGLLRQRGAMTFDYATRGELLRASQGADRVDYAYDGAGRRVSRSAGGVTTEYLYGDPTHAVAVTATRGPGGLTTYYRDEAGHVFAFERGGERYLVATDQAGSAVAIADGAGEVVKSIAYDSFGNVISDSDPHFPYPFAFGGGLADDVTGLVRFGMRDYDPQAGRWTARDPSLAAGSDGNLYGYVGNDPINRSDPVGLWSIALSAYGGLGGGLKLSWTKEGFSFCSEVGAGAGVEFEFDPESDLDEPGDGLFGELEFNGAGFIKAKLKGQLGGATICGLLTPEPLPNKFEPEFCVGPACVSEGRPIFNWDGQIPNFEPKVGIAAKAGYKACGAGKW